MTELFDRRWRLQAGPFVTDALRVAFEVNRTLDYHLNTATISVYNVSKDTRDVFDGGQSVSLFAGYAGGVDLLFAGQIYDVGTKRDGPTWVTTMQCRDGNASWSRYIRQSYSQGASVSKVVQDIAGAMGLQVPPSTLAVLAGRQTRGALVQSGLGFRALQDVLTSEGLQWSVQGGVLQVLEQGASTAEQAIVLDAQSGLIGTPQREETKTLRVGTRRVTVSATSLLQGGLRPGRRVVLRSATISGDYVVQTVTHRGDSRGQDWYSEPVMVAANG